MVGAAGVKAVHVAAKKRAERRVRRNRVMVILFEF